MPKYEYACKSCDERLEVTQSFSDAPLTECPSCGGPLRKVFSPPAITFNGSGFYRTDNRRRRSEPAKPDAKSDKGETKSDGGDAKAGGAAEPAKKDSSATPKAAEATSA